MAKKLARILTVLKEAMGTGSKVKSRYVNGAVVIVPTYIVIDEAGMKRCSAKILDLICDGHYVKLTSRTSRASLERALKKAFRAPQAKQADLEAWDVYDREFS